MSLSTPTTQQRDNAWTPEQRERQRKRALELNAKRRGRLTAHAALAKVFGNFKAIANDDEIEPQT